MQALEFIGLGSGDRPSAVVAVLRGEHGEGGDRLLSAGPVGLMRLLPDAVLAATVRCAAFTLAVHGGRACFSRNLRLPPQLRGLGLGTWLMAALVRRAVALGLGAARVRSLHLVARDASALRDHFYRSMGFAVTVWRDGSGWARVARLDALRRHADPVKVRLLHRCVPAEVPPSDLLMRTLAAGASRR